MAGIAGIFAAGREEQVRRMMKAIAHRGRATPLISDVGGATWGIVHTESPEEVPMAPGAGVQDYVDEGHYARAFLCEDHPLLVRDPIGVAPLYYGRTEDGSLCFASEVKAMLAVTHDIHELPPGHQFDGRQPVRRFDLQRDEPVADSPEDVAAELHRRLAGAVGKCAKGGVMGAWLSGGLDSSAIATLARPHVEVLHTFAVGLPGAPDLACAREVAGFIDSRHHEIVVRFQALLEILPAVIFHLESFDALLIRSSITNYIASRAASDHVAAVFSGEGADELFAGYEYLKALDPASLQDELIELVARLHNTALQRVDRCASAHGTVAHVCFLDPELLDYALRIPTDLKIRGGIEKWILRCALDGGLPQNVLDRPKTKFWEGAGVGDLLARHADQRISDADFRRERRLSNGWELNTKEELMYYRLFEETFGTLTDLSWMGRTKNAPRALDP